jgi:mannose-6-phosphate isomerase-like protein (cupin superfamily)
MFLSSDIYHIAEPYPNKAMKHTPLTVIDLKQETANTDQPYSNFPVAFINDHVIRASIMTEEFYWHYHPNSDETFLVIEGTLLINLEDETIELHVGQLFTIPKNVVHRTRPKDGRSVNITFEHAELQTVTVK